MTPYYQDEYATIYHGDALSVLRGLPSESVQCCVTSPPYWGLRDYGTATWEGGDSECDHKPTVKARATRPKGKLVGSTRTVDESTIQRNCHCGAVRVDSQLGIESTPEEYVANMVDVFREVRRVLRDDGTLWLNLGDSYHGGGSTTRNGQDTSLYLDKSNIAGTYTDGMTSRPVKARDYAGYKPKDLVGIPWRVAFALQADGWYLRQDIIWHKPNPMPESVTDRCTKAHEYIFLLTKSARYFYDQEAVKEPLSNPPHAPGNNKLDASRNDHDQMQKVWGLDGTRNKRSVWTVSTQSYKEAHFATFPPKLIEPCILAGCPAGGTVLDTFGGSGTTAFVAKSHNRKSVSIELNSEYLPLMEARLSQGVLPLFETE